MAGPLCQSCALLGALELPLELEVATDGGAVRRNLELRGEHGDYELLEEIGRGGMGVVYRARQRSLDRLVAVKVIRADRVVRMETIQRFRREAAAAAGLQHSGIVAVHDSGEVDGQPFYSMDLVDGPSLAELVRRRRLSPEEAAAMVREIAEAVDYAHGRGVLHRDLKPSNVLIGADGRPRVSDFGLAKLIEGGPRLTATSEVIGSPCYMAPEQAGGRNRQVDARTDVYALGATLYHLLTGNAPFEAESPVETLRHVLEREPIPPRRLDSRVPRDLETICLTCLAKSPSRRYASAGEVAAELGRFLGGVPITARPVGLLERTYRWCRRRPLAAGLVLVLVAAGWFAWQNHIASSGLKRERQRAAIEAAVAAACGGSSALTEKRIAEAVQCGVPPEWERMLRGQVALNTLRTEAAVAEFEAAVELEPASIPARAMLATAYLYSGRDGDYMRLLPELASMTPRTAMDHQFLGSALVAGFPDTARPVALLEHALALRPSGICMMQLSMAEAFHAADLKSWPMADRAIRHAESATTLLGDDHPAALAVTLNAFNVVLRLGPDGERSEALAGAARTARTLADADHPVARMQRAFYFQETGDERSELAEWRRTVEDGGGGLFQSYYAAAMLGRQRSAEALEELDRLGAPETGLAGAARVLLLLDTGQHDAALRLRRTHVESAALASLLTETIPPSTDQPAAASEAAPANRPAPEQASGFFRCSAHYEAAMASLARGRRDQAERHFAAAVETGLYWLPAFQWSRSLLARMQDDPTWLGWTQRSSF